MLSDKQRRLVSDITNSKYKYYIAAGEPGSGKTYGFGYGIVSHSIDRPGGYYIVAAQSAEAAQSNMGKVIKQAIEELGGEYIEYRGMQRPRIEASFNNREMVEFRFFGAKDRDSGASIQGRNAAGVVIDEIGLCSKEFYVEAKKRMRDGEGTVMLCNFNKLRKRHWTTKELYNSKEKNVSVTDWYTKDNEYLPDDYLDEMEILNNTNRRNDGFQIVEDAVYPIDMVSTYNEESVKDEYGFISIDYGAAGVTCALYLRPGDDDEEIWLVDDEIYIDHKLDGWMSSERIAEMITERWPNVDRGLIDHNAVDLRNILSIEYGVAMRLANKDINKGVAQTQAMLNNKRLIINERCECLLDELDEYQLDPETGKPIKKNDHAVDALRYAGMEIGYS